MQQTVPKSGVTFAVDRVRPAEKPLAEQRAHEALREHLGSIESCSDYHGTVVAAVRYQPLLAAVYTAFNDHRPLVLTPDAVWLTIAQGVAHHMALEGERLRSRFVAHAGRLALTFERDAWVPGSPENPWAEAFASWAGQISDHVGTTVHDAIVCDFSTSGPVEVAASHVVMMDVFERYFHYVAVGICGIPTVTLEGTREDWERLAAKVEALQVFDLDWWLSHLRPICAQFVRASRGDVDVDHWQRICKLREAYGGHLINGWIAKLFPYLRNGPRAPCTRRNRIFDSGEGFPTYLAPTGLSRVPFTWKDASTGRSRQMEAIGGLVGMTQDEMSLALRPKVGWAVREADRADGLIRRVIDEHAPAVAGVNTEDLPVAEVMGAFYFRTNGAEFYGHGAAAMCRILPATEVLPLDAAIDDGWYRFATLADGSCFAINFDPNDPRPPRIDWWLRDELSPVIHVTGVGNYASARVIALTFVEFLGHLLDAGPRRYWIEPGFVDHGAAALYTRGR